MWAVDSLAEANDHIPEVLERHIGRIAEAAVCTVEVAAHKKALADCNDLDLTSDCSRSYCLQPTDLEVDIGSFSLWRSEVAM